MSRVFLFAAVTFERRHCQLMTARDSLHVRGPSRWLITLQHLSSLAVHTLRDPEIIGTLKKCTLCPQL